ncbi:unnamed protein product [Blepharisma stoltei]|uniref:F-box domain-containing protein n=1 Tax=Blepharisma stoltei TaxID=1481888 RepID=A0AAU9JAP0_9CILI|nr:unnamed protein product [Blepharisma stoltei]
MQSVPDPIIVEILSYLPISEIIRAESICKKIKSCVEKHSYVLYSRVLSRFSQESISYSHWKNVIKQMNSPSKELQFLPYYTNGGTYYGSNTYYIHNLVLEGYYCYCTVYPTNILVKYALLGTDYDTDRIRARQYISSGVNEGNDRIYFEKEILRESQEFTSQASIYAVIKQIYARAPQGGYTCPIFHFMCFSSIEEDADLGIIDRFNGVSTIDKAKEISDQLGLEYEEVSANSIRQLVFNNCNLPMQPLCWAEMSEDYNQSALNLPLKSKKLARYFYGLLIDGRRTNNYDNNIDISLLLPKGSIIHF